MFLLSVMFQHVQNKSAFLCGVMKIHRQKAKHEKEGLTNVGDLKRSGPSESKIKVRWLVLFFVNIAIIVPIVVSFN